MLTQKNVYVNIWFSLFQIVWTTDVDLDTMVKLINIAMFSIDSICCDVPSTAGGCETPSNIIS